MQQKGVLSKAGGILAIISLTVLPLAGCGNSTVSGIEVLTTEDVSIGVKLLLIVSVLCAIGALFGKTRVVFLTLGLVGLGSLITSYVILRQEYYNMIEMKTGGYLSIISFILILGDGFISSQNNST